MQKIQISDHFTYPRLLRFALPSILMMVFNSLYTIVDGVFVSNLAGPEAFASLNLIWPIIGILTGFGFMIGSGGTALVSKTLGEGKQEKACSLFTMLVVFEVVLGIVVALCTIPFLKQIAYWMGATEDLVADCVRYATPLLAAPSFFYLATSFQSFLVAASKPKFGLVITLITGITNMVLDYIFLAVFKIGIVGAAWATVISWIIGALIPLIWFWRHQEAQIHLSRFQWDLKALGRACFNGSSEMVTSLSASLVLMLYNLALMRLAGPDGVNSYGVIQYTLFLFSSAFFGYTMAAAPCIGYQYGAANHKELHNLTKKSLVIIGSSSVVLCILAAVLAPALSHVFVSYSPTMMAMTEHAMRIFALSFLMSGTSIFASGFFTALNNGLVSAVLSFGRALAFQTGAISLLPLWFGLEGVWWSSIVAEFLSLILSIGFLVILRKKYHY